MKTYHYIVISGTRRIAGDLTATDLSAAAREVRWLHYGYRILSIIEG